MSTCCWLPIKLGLRCQRTALDGVPELTWPGLLRQHLESAEASTLFELPNSFFDFQPGISANHATRGMNKGHKKNAVDVCFEPPELNLSELYRFPTSIPSPKEGVRHEALGLLRAPELCQPRKLSTEIPNCQIISACKTGSQYLVICVCSLFERAAGFAGGTI